jgi:hypothetical protein
MTPRTPRVCAAIALAVVGCSYDWAVPAPSDAGAPIDATAPYDAGPPDLVDASDAAPDSPGDANVDALPNCDSLIAAAASEYALARACTSSCTTATDQCGCAKPVGDDSSAATRNYEQAVAAITDAGCATGCGQCSPPSLVCLDMATGDGGFTMACD